MAKRTHPLCFAHEGRIGFRTNPRNASASQCQRMTLDPHAPRNIRQMPMARDQSRGILAKKNYGCEKNIFVAMKVSWPTCAKRRSVWWYVPSSGLVFVLLVRLPSNFSTVAATPHTAHTNCVGRRSCCRRKANPPFYVPPSACRLGNNNGRHKVVTMMYLKISLFSARSRTWAFNKPPGKLLVAAFVVAVGLSTILAVTWPLGEGASKIDGQTAAFVWVYCLVWVVLQDTAKVSTIWLMERHNWFNYNHAVSNTHLCERYTETEKHVLSLFACSHSV